MLIAGLAFILILILISNIKTASRNVTTNIKCKDLGRVYMYPVLTIRFYSKRDSSDRYTIHIYLDRFLVVFTRNRICFLSGQTSC